MGASGCGGGIYCWVGGEHGIFSVEKAAGGKRAQASGLSGHAIEYLYVSL